MRKATKTRKRAANGSGKEVLVVSIETQDWRSKHAIQAAAAERGWRVLDTNLTDESIPPDISPRFAIVRRPADDPLCMELRKRGVHIVRMGVWNHPMDNVMPAVLANREVGGRMAAEHFAERGFRSVGMIHFVLRRSPLEIAFGDHATKKLGCRFSELDLAPIDKRFPPDQTYKRQAEAFSAWIADVPRPIGLLLRSDYQAARICHFCSLENITVPDEVALLGLGNEETICNFAPVRLSSIFPDSEARISACFEILDGLSAGRDFPKAPVLIPPKGIVTRESTDIHASQNPDVAKALRHMWNHYDDLELSVGTIADIVGFSRRKLERLFRSEVDLSVNSALLSRRMERCCELLITTNLRISDIHYRIGIRSREHLHRTFKQVHGMTPEEYRKKHHSSA